MVKPSKSQHWRLTRSVFFYDRLGVFTEAAGVLEQIPLLIFEDGQYVFAPRTDIVEKVAASIEPVPRDHVERARVKIDQPVE